MASVLKVDKLDPQSGTALEIGTSGDTLNVPSGVTLDINSGATLDATGATVTGAIGKVLQVVANQLNASGYTTDVQAWIAIVDMDVAITPSATSSKVLVSFNCGGYSVLDNQAIQIRIKRDTTIVRECGRWAYQRSDDYTSLPISITYLDSPSTTSEVTYTIEMYVDAGSLHINRDGDTNGGVTIAQEIGA